MSNYTLKKHMGSFDIRMLHLLSIIFLLLNIQNVKEKKDLNKA